MAEKQENQLRLPPHSVEAEQAVLGCMLIDVEAVPKAMHHLKEDSFYKTENGIIFSHMMKLFEENHSIDTVTILDSLKKEEQLDVVGGAYYITGLSSEAPSAANVEFYAQIVKNKAILRTIISAAVKMSTTAYDSKDDPTNILDEAEQQLFQLSEHAERGRFKSVEPLLHQVLDNWGNRKSGVLTGVPSGLYDIDDKLSGFQNSDLIIIAGRPSMGKTALALSLARNAAIEYGHKVGLFSLEMSNQQLVERLITAEARIDSHLVRTGRLPKNEWKKLSRVAEPLSKAEIYIDDSAGLNIMELRAKARQLKAEKDIDIFYVDYLQLLNAGSRSESRQQEISYISRSLKALAKELNVPIVVLSQLSRAVESRTDHRPIMSDLRESGAIEQDADVILFVYRKFVYSKDEEDFGKGEVIIAKHRNGPTGTVSVTFVDKYARFENQENIHSEEYSGVDMPM
jgi:replicative DNA helicase